MHSRDELKALIERHGGKNLAAVSANVDYLVAGEKMGPAKLRKAEKLGVRIISEADFLGMLTDDAPPETPSAPEPAHEVTSASDSPAQGSLF